MPATFAILGSRFAVTINIRRKLDLVCLAKSEVKRQQRSSKAILRTRHPSKLLGVVAERSVETAKDFVQTQRSDLI